MTLGVWEATAFTTGKVPTVSYAYSRWRTRHPILSRVVLLGWLLSIGWHLHRTEGKF